MKVKILNKLMLCWNEFEFQAKEYHVLAKVTECKSEFQYKVITIENTYRDNHSGILKSFKNAKPLPEYVEMTVSEISKLLGKQVKIIE